MSENITPTLHKVTRHNGVAGQLVYVADVEYPGEPRALVEFVGSTYGGPVIIRTATLPETFVTEPERFGRLSPRWVRRFFGIED